MTVPGTHVELAEKLADTARAHVRPYHRAQPAITWKADGSPVTAADREAEQAMRALIREHAPDHGIVGEEYGAESTDAEWCWLIDPIDGTKQFLTGKPSYGTLIGLFRGREPVLGVIDMPVLDERWLGVAGRGTRHSDTAGTRFATTRRCADLGQAALCTTIPTSDDEQSAEAFLMLAESVGLSVSGGDCHNYGLLASGHCDVVLDATMSLHDHAALVPVVQGAGGVITDAAGEPLRRDRAEDCTVVAAADPQVHAQALAAMAGG